MKQHQKKKKDCYSTIDEAKKAVERLGIGSSFTYLKRFKEDPRLPSDPSKFYANKGWVDWYDLTGRKRPEYYSTLKEAKHAVKRLGIKNGGEYSRRFREDPGLPVSPLKFYKNKGWVDRYNFFGRKRPYATLKEAKQAVQRLKIKSSEEYWKRYKKDQRLTSHPPRFYKEKGWIDWSDFFGKK